MVWACDQKTGTIRRKGAMEMKVQGRRKRGRPKRRWLDRVRDDIKEKGLSADEVYGHATCRRISYRTSTPHKSRNKKRKTLNISRGLYKVKKIPKIQNKLG